jgi:predicted dehydrogenase/threonine dehydrogenase-like Zn-dependent dehydrogenase
MKQAVLCKGNVIPRDVANPKVDSLGILVKIECSCISAGTEMSSVRNSKKSLIKRALEKPEQAKASLKILKDRGFGALSNVIKRATGSAFGNALGYSAAGTVVAVGERTGGFFIGQRVAIAGTGYANHSGYAYVPQNLAVPIPDGVNFEEAATVALGSIAMQGVRILDPGAGEHIVVMGLGLVGQLAVQILVSAGCRVIGIDINQRRLEIAKSQYKIDVIDGKDKMLVSRVMMLTKAQGADGVLFTAATSSSEPMSNCFKMLRKKGRFILVGVSGMNIDRADLYKKELEFKIATSYGPGRYDSNYEEGGIDYPYDYVRWTEKRNMEFFLALINQKKVQINYLIDGVYPVEKSVEAYQTLKSFNAPLIILLSYGNSHDNQKDRHEDLIHMQNSKMKQKKPGAITYAIVGAGSFARSMHLPNLAKHSDKFYLKAVMSRTGISAVALAAQYGAEYSTTNMQYILDDPDIELVIICTRHNLHAPLAIQALRAGKNVFVEKPPAINESQLDELVATIKETGKAYIVGYNRRFSKYIQEIDKHTRQRTGKMFLEYTMNAGYIDYSHWAHGKEGGGRIIGEGCHIVDLLGFLTGSKPKKVAVNHLLPVPGFYMPHDNVSVTVTYEDGSLAVMNYISNGSPSYSKETLKVYFDGKTITMDNYMILSSENLKVKKIKSGSPNKGQEDEMLIFFEYLKNGKKYPIPLDEIATTSRLTFQITDSVREAYNKQLP